MNIDIKTVLMIGSVAVSGLSNYFTMDTRVALLEQKVSIESIEKKELITTVKNLNETVIKLSTILEGF